MSKQSSGPTLSAHARSEIYRVELDRSQVNDPRIIALHMIAPNSVVLDVGCACGDFGALIAREKNCTVHGIEADADSLRIAAQSGSYKSLMQMDLNECALISNYSQGPFDVIVALDVLEHLLNPLQTLRSLSGLLKPGGAFAISLPNVAHGDVKLKLLRNDFTYTDVGILDKTHLKFFTYASIASLMTDADLQVSEVTPKVADFTAQNGITPMLVKLYVARDPHSFVFQYVLKAHLAQGHGGLCDANLNKLKHSYSSVPDQVLRPLRRIAIKNIAFPFQSLRHRVAKFLFRRLHSQKTGK